MSEKQLQNNEHTVHGANIPSFFTEPVSPNPTMHIVMPELHPAEMLMQEGWRRDYAEWHRRWMDDVHQMD